MFFILCLVDAPLEMEFNIAFSPGSAKDKESGIKLIAEYINKAHKETSFIKLVLENAAGIANSIGNRFEDLRDIIELVEGTPLFHSFPLSTSV